MKENDPTIDRIRQVRHQISAEFGHDPKRLVAFYANLEKELSDRFLEERPEKEELSVGVVHR
jgi:hypothetical protein